MEELPVRNDQLSSRLPSVPGSIAIPSQYSREGVSQDGTDVSTSVFIDTRDRALFRPSSCDDRRDDLAYEGKGWKV